MSVLIVDLMVYDYVREGVIKVAFLNEHTEFYSEAIRQHFKTKDDVEEATRLVKSWFALNERSYNMMYHNSTNVKLPDFLEYSSRHNLTVLQFLKYLICISYNISKGAILSDLDRIDYELLLVLIENIKDSFIGNLPEYQNANWCSHER